MASYKKALLGAVLGLSILGTSTSLAQAKNITFKDVSKNYWAYSSIQWGIDHQLINGFPGGTFRPNQAVNQKEFLAMLIRSFNPSDLKSSNSAGEWAAPYLNYGKKLGWAMTGGASASGFTRGGAAVFMTNSAGKNYSMEDAILFLLDQGLVQGKSGASLAGYQKGDKVTRAEAVALIQRLKQKYTKLQAMPSSRQAYQNQSISYRNDKYRFSLKLPNNWRDKYEVKEQALANGDVNINFISKAGKKSILGIVFTIGLWSEKAWRESEDDIKGQIPIWELGSKANKVYVLHTPTDVQVRPEDEKAAKEYELMFAGVKSIRSTFDFIK